MFNQLKQQYRLLLLDFVIVAATPYVALFVRFEGQISNEYLDMMRSCLPVLLAVYLVVFQLYGFYQRLWRYTAIQDLFAIIGAVSVGSALLFAGGFYWRVAMPGSVHALIWALNIGCIGFSRLLIKAMCFRKQAIEAERATRVLIVGAGDAGAMLAREIAQHRGRERRIVAGYIDDDAGKRGSLLLGAPVLGTSEEIERIVQETKAEEIVIAIPSAKGCVVRRIAAACRCTGCKVKVVPGLYELIDGKVALNQLRDISLEDLLRREPVKLDLQEITAYLKGRAVLVTGAGGSIGSELCRQISLAGAKQLILLGRGENSIYQIHQELLAKHPGKDYVPVICDVRDQKRLESVFARYRPAVVFHAAAHKHVPLMELQPEEAVKNNIFGTQNVVECADRYRCERFVLISSDKAVNPTSVMGATKRVAELVLLETNQRSQTSYAAVRFGNVLGSRGSVVPLFKKQIAAGGPVTVTHPEMTRYFMTIPEAVQLVLQAGAQAQGGEVFLLDMGAPVKILDLAKDLIELHGLELGKDIQIAVTGLRAGEKLYEELLTVEEGAQQTKHEKIYIALLQPIDAKRLESSLKRLQKAEAQQQVRYLLKELVPSYSGAGEEAAEEKAPQRHVEKVS